MAEVSANTAGDATDACEALGRAMLDAVDDYAETAHLSLIPALQPAFAAQAEHVRRAVGDLVTIAQRGRA